MALHTQAALFSGLRIFTVRFKMGVDWILLFVKKYAFLQKGSIYVLFIL